VRGVSNDLAPATKKGPRLMFLSAFFLVGLVTLAVPWWVHHLRAHASDRRVVSSLLLMRPSESPVHLQKRLQHLWLMALRMLILVILVIAFARPVLEFVSSAPVASVPSRVVVVDTSLSMASGDVFEQAQNLAGKLLDDAAAGQRRALITVSDVITVVSPLTQDSALLASLPGSLSPGTSHLAFDGLAGRLDDLLAGMVVKGERVSVHLISDFQQAAIPARFNSLIAESAWPLVLHPVGATAQNWAITQLKLEGDLLSVNVSGYNTPETVTSVTVREQPGTSGAPVKHTLTIPANGSATVNIPVTQDGDRWTVNLASGDSLAVDNVAYIVRKHTESVNLPVYAGTPRAQQYLRAAVAASVPRFKPVSMEGSATTSPVIAVIDPGPMPSAVTGQLTRHLRSGGAVFMTVGPDTRAAGQLPVVDTPLSSSRFDTSARGLVAVDRSHPILDGFSDWRGVSVFQRVLPEDDGAMRVLLMADDGEPILVEYRVGSGRLVVLLTALDPEWSSLVVQPAFVEFVGNLLGYLAEDVLPVSAVVGEPVTFPALSVQLTDPLGNRVLGLSDTVERPTVILSTPGLYEVRTPGGTRPMAVNVPDGESDLSPAPASLLARWADAMQGSNATGGNQAASAQSPATGTTTSTPTSTSTTATATAQSLVELSWWLLLVLLAFAVLEPLASNLGWGSRQGAVL
jgi:hypothetical protein